MKNIYILVQLFIGLFLSITAFGQTTLVAGDIAIVAYNADEVGNEDEFSFVLMRDIAANTQIHVEQALVPYQTVPLPGRPLQEAYFVGLKSTLFVAV